ncbi:unnamed protein product, partial [Rotaria magnacalcarata]
MIPSQFHDDHKVRALPGSADELAKCYAW